MERSYQFRIGQSVYIKDEYGNKKYGLIYDKATNCVIIYWDDLTEPTQYFQNEYDKIYLG